MGGVEPFSLLFSVLSQHKGATWLWFPFITNQKGTPSKEDTQFFVGGVRDLRAHCGRAASREAEVV